MLAPSSSPPAACPWRAVPAFPGRLSAAFELITPELAEAGDGADEPVVLVMD